MGFLRLVGIPEDFFLFVCFFFKLTDALADLLFRQYKLCGRVDSDAFQLLNGTLAQDVEAADGLHLISPQFDTIGVFLRQIKDIHTAATDGELPRAFHLIGFLISHSHQSGCQFALVQTAAPLGADDVFLLPQYLRCHQCRIGGNNGDRLTLHDSAQGLDPLLHQLIAVDIRLEKDQVLRRIQHDISVIKAIFLVDLFGL